VSDKTIGAYVLGPVALRLGLLTRKRLARTQFDLPGLLTSQLLLLPFLPLALKPGVELLLQLGFRRINRAKDISGHRISLDLEDLPAADRTDTLLAGLNSVDFRFSRGGLSAPGESS
jgi:hypothetical protein